VAQDTKKNLAKRVWSDENYYDVAKKGSKDLRHPGMIVLAGYAKRAFSIIDLGCGEGTRLSKFCKDGKECVGVDISTKAINLAKETYPEIKFIKADLEKLPFKDSSFDLAYSAFVLEHTRKPEKVLKEASRILKNKAILVLIAPNYGAPNRASPPYKDSRMAKLASGFLNDLTKVFRKSKRLGWKKVRPIATKNFYDIDYDTTVEPYIRSLISFLRSLGMDVEKFTTCWETERKDAFFHQKAFRILGELNIYPFKYWGPHLVVVARKHD
jgi:ubiquinone/menaquinone biosynthesis C-methylase UbiE